MQAKVNATNATTELKKLPQTATPEKGKTNPQHVEREVKSIVPPTAEQRIRNLDNFKILSEKFSFLKDKEDELQKFILSSDGTKEKIIMSNANGYEFKITNTQTIEKVTAIINEDLLMFKAAAEKEILAFTI